MTSACTHGTISLTMGVFLTRDIESAALVGSHAGHTKVRQASRHLPEGQLYRVGAWLVQLGLIHYQGIDLSFLWGYEGRHVIPQRK